MMGRRPQAQSKWILRVLFCVVLFSVSSSAGSIYETLSLQRTVPPDEPEPTENTGSTVHASSSPLPPLPLVHSHLQSDGPHSLSYTGALPDVSVTCASFDFVVRVKAAFYGLGADRSELRLGSACRSNNEPKPFADLLFRYPLSACDRVLELLPGYVAYKFVLHYEPSAQRFPAQPITVDIECRYPRNYHMHKLVVQPTWETHIVRKPLKAGQASFQIQMMDGAWKHPVQPRVFQLGETVNFQVSALHLTPGQKVYIRSCFATPVSNLSSHIQFTIIDNYGCLVDSKTEPGAATFVSRTDEYIRFSMKAFQFVTCPDSEISMHCELHFTSASPSPAHKSCTYLNSWKALSGEDTICECCDSQCVTSQRQRAMMDGVHTSGSVWVSSHSPAIDPQRVHPGGINNVKHGEESGEAEGHSLDSNVQSNTAEVRDGETERPVAADGNVRTKTREVLQENSGAHGPDGKRTWYFTWR